MAEITPGKVPSFTTGGTFTPPPPPKDLLFLAELAAEICGCVRAKQHFEAQSTPKYDAWADQLEGQIEEKAALLEEVLGRVLRSAFPTEAQWEQQLRNLKTDAMEPFTHQRQTEELIGLFSAEQRERVLASLGAAAVMFTREDA